MVKMPILKVLSGVAVLVATIAPLADAQTNPFQVTCQTMGTLRRGVQLIYRVTGTLPENQPIAVPQNPIGTTFTITVQQRDRNGRVQTLIDRAALSSYEQMAPDADYSRLPFQAAFRSRPNQGDRLYAAPASTHGLYVSLRPTTGQPQQIQTIHYVRPGQYVRSTVGTCQPEKPS